MLCGSPENGIRLFLATPRITQCLTEHPLGQGPARNVLHHRHRCDSAMLGDLGVFAVDLCDGSCVS